MLSADEEHGLQPETAAYKLQKPAGSFRNRSRITELCGASR